MSETSAPPRVPPISPPYPPGIEEGLKRASPRWRNSDPLAIFRVWARHPRLGRAIGPIGAFLLDDGEVDSAHRELVILRTCARAGAEYEWGVHAAGYSPRSGLSPEVIEATARLSTDDPCWSETDRLLLQLVDEFEESVDVSDALWSKLVSRWTQAQVLELLLVTGFYRYVSFTARATRTPLEAWASRFPVRRATKMHKGSCLCGRIRYELSAQPGDFGYCHCTSCRKASGSAHAANAPIDRENFHLTSGTDVLREYESSPGKFRTFCSMCGSPIFAYLAAMPSVVRLRLGSLDTPFDAKPRAHTFVGEKATWEPTILDEIPQFEQWASKEVLHQRGSRQDTEGDGAASPRRGNQETAGALHRYRCV